MLKGAYHTDRLAIADILEVFIREVTIPDKPAISYAFRLHGRTSPDFADYLLAGYHHVNGEEIVTFHEKLHKAMIKDQVQE